MPAGGDTLCLKFLIWPFGHLENRCMYSGMQSDLLINRDGQAEP